MTCVLYLPHLQSQVIDFSQLKIQHRLVLLSIAILSVTSPIVINVPTRGLLAVETKNSFVLWLANLNI